MALTYIKYNICQCNLLSVKTAQTCILVWDWPKPILWNQRYVWWICMFIPSAK